MLAVLGTRAGVSIATLLAWRYVLAAAALVAVAVHAGAFRGTRRDAVEGVVVGGAGQALVAGLTLSALRWIPTATLGFLFYTFPGWIALLAALCGTEHVGRRQAAALALSFAGIVLTVGAPRADGGGAWPGVLLALAGALTYALYVPFLHRLEARTSPAAASAYVTVGAAIACAAAAAVDGTLTTRLGAVGWSVAAALALVCTVVAFLAFLRGLATLGPVRAAIVATVEPFWTAVLGAAVLGQRLTPSTLAGGALIAAAVMWLAHERRAAG